MVHWTLHTMGQAMVAQWARRQGRHLPLATVQAATTPLSLRLRLLGMIRRQRPQRHPRPCHPRRQPAYPLSRRPWRQRPHRRGRCFPFQDQPANYPQQTRPGAAVAAHEALKRPTFCELRLMPAVASHLGWSGTDLSTLIKSLCRHDDADQRSKAMTGCGRHGLAL